MKRILISLLIAAALVVGVAAWFINSAMTARLPSSPASVRIDIPRGMSTRGILQLLQDKGVLADANVAAVYLAWSGNRGRLQAGEYLFDRPLRLDETLMKLVRGEVFLHKWTVPEGLTMKEIATKWEGSGFGSAANFLEAVRERQVTEGYLFPETYFFPSGTSAIAAVDAMTARFRDATERLQREVPAGQWALNLAETVTLASLIESEAQHEEERPLISSVFRNRLQRRMKLDCDPTVIYALEIENRYQGRLRLADLKIDSPYNTYRFPGLPPGPIANPGYASMRAAVLPASTNYLFFVRTVDGRHKFSSTLAQHNRAVMEYRAMMRRAK